MNILQPSVKYQPGDKVIDISSTILAKDVVIGGVVPKKWWHRQQRYIIPLGGIYDYRKEDQLMERPSVTEGEELK